ncbi:ABC transporter permease [Frigidibacter sp. MR17.14]|uniref:ABC transporter permease n=1 Tax=Frigidibacter sp. MR17.14 TaxID=3126509 RepID=UPI003012FBC5
MQQRVTVAETAPPAVPAALRPPRRSGRGPIFLASLAALVALWWGLAILKADPQVLPDPPSVLAVFWDETLSGRLPHHLLATLRRVAIAFVLAMAIGSVIGVALGRNRTLDMIADAWVTVFLNLPALVLIVLCYLWIGLNETAAILAVTLNKTAMVIVTLREGARTFDPTLRDMTRAFGFSRWKRFRHVMLPELAPFLATAARNGLAVIWKIVLVVEFLGRSDGIGFRIHMHFQLFQTAHVMAYALAFVAVMLAVDYLAIQPFERRARAWRKSP